MAIPTSVTGAQSIASPAGKSPAATAAPSGAKSAAKASLFGSYTLQSLKTAPGGSVSAASVSSEDKTQTLRTALEAIAMSATNDKSQTSAEELRRPVKKPRRHGERQPMLRPSDSFRLSTKLIGHCRRDARQRRGGAVGHTRAHRCRSATGDPDQRRRRVGVGRAEFLGHHTLSIDITPQHWGRMQITLTQTPAGADGGSKATATIVTESESARQAMLGQVKELRESLQAGGVKIDKIEIVAAPKPGVATLSDSMVSGVAEAGSGSLAGNAQQQPQSQSQHHSHSGPRFEFGGGASGAAAGGAGGQGRGATVLKLFRRRRRPAAFLLEFGTFIPKRNQQH